MNIYISSYNIDFRVANSLGMKIRELIYTPYKELLHTPYKKEIKYKKMFMTYSEAKVAHAEDSVNMRLVIYKITLFILPAFMFM